MARLAEHRMPLKERPVSPKSIVVGHGRENNHATFFKDRSNCEMVIAWTSATNLSIREARSDRVSSQYSSDDTLI